MGLFPKELDIASGGSGHVPRRMQFTRELGTRKLIFGLIALAAAWFVYGKVQDRILLNRHWETLAPRPNGLTVVGTLNSRDSYDRNLFKIITANKTSRVVITEFGLRSIFDVRNGPLFDDQASNAIEAAIKQDSVEGYAFLTPFLRATVNKQLGDTQAYRAVQTSTPVTVPQHDKMDAPGQTTIEALMAKYSNTPGSDSGERSDVPEAGSGSGREKENVLTIPAENLINACPVVLTDQELTGASIEEMPGSLIAPKTYTVHLNLSPEGRSRFFQWSYAHQNENVVFVLKGQVVAAPRITSPLDVSDFEISNLQDAQAAKAVVDFVNQPKR